MKNLFIGQRIFASVVKIYKTFVLLETPKKQTCRLDLKEVSDFFVEDLNEIFKVGEKIEVVVIGYYVEKRTYIVSFKQLHPRFLNRPFEFKFDQKNCSFDKLLSFCKRELKNDWKN